MIITVDGSEYNVLVAGNFLSRMRGLSFRDRPEYDGMLFVFPYKRRWPMWMLGMRFGIDIIWLSDDWRIAGCEKNIPRPKNIWEFFKIYRPCESVKYVLEVCSEKNKKTRSKFQWT